MSRPRLLDLFCGAGGAAEGYYRAGFDVVGVDIADRPNYPFAFHQADALEFLAEHGRDFDAIHASPPCQAHTRAQRLWGREHIDLIPATRAGLRSIGRLWVMENVVGAPLHCPLTLCGTEFGLGVRCGDGVYRALRRHRLFEASTWLMGAGGCVHGSTPVITVFGNGGPRSNPRPGDTYEGSASERRQAMGIPWMNRTELSQAIPPAYTEHIGEQLIAHLTAAVAA